MGPLVVGQGSGPRVLCPHLRPAVTMDIGKAVSDSRPGKSVPCRSCGTFTRRLRRRFRPNDRECKVLIDAVVRARPAAAKGRMSSASSSTIMGMNPRRPHQDDDRYPHRSPAGWVADYRERQRGARWQQLKNTTRRGYHSRARMGSIHCRLRRATRGRHDQLRKRLHEAGVSFRAAGTRCRRAAAKLDSARQMILGLSAAAFGPPILPRRPRYSMSSWPFEKPTIRRFVFEKRSDSDS